MFPVLFLAGQAIFGASAAKIINSAVPVAYVAIKEWEIEKRDDESNLGLNHKLAGESYRLRYENIVKSFGSNKDEFSRSLVEDAQQKLNVPSDQLMQDIRPVTWNTEGLPQDLVSAFTDVWWVTDTEQIVIDAHMKLRQSVARQGPFYDYVRGISEKTGEDVMNVINNFIELEKAPYLDEQVRLIHVLSERRKKSGDLTPSKTP